MKLFKWESKKVEKSEQESERLVSNPFLIQVENTSNSCQEFVLFGSSRFYREPNFGNNDSVKISCLSENTTYASLLADMISTSYQIGLMRVQSNNPKNIRQTLSHNMQNHNAGMYDVVFEQREIKLAIMLDAYQFQSDILDVRLPNLKLDKNHYFSGKIEPKTIIVFSIFPVTVNGVNYKNERLSGKNVAPVIIQTTSSFKRIIEGSETFLKKFKNLFRKKKKNKNK